MKLGVTVVNAGPGAEPGYALGLAHIAEDLGVESLWTVEHVVVPEDYTSIYPYASAGKMPGGTQVPIADPMVWLSFVAAATERIKLGTAVMILPQRNPVIFAKECATLDRLSGGRLLLGVGVGWLREEFDALGVPFQRRGDRADDYIRAMRVLWQDEDPTYRGEFASFERARMWPKPVTKIPVLVGGHTEAAAKRAGRLGDGFFPWRVTPDELAPLLDLMRAEAKDAGRDPDEIEITTGVRDLDPDLMKAYAALGVSRVIVTPGGFTLEDVQRSLGEMVERARVF